MVELPIRSRGFSVVSCRAPSFCISADVSFGHKVGPSYLKVVTLVILSMTARKLMPRSMVESGTRPLW